MPPSPFRRILAGLIVFVSICVVASFGYVREGWTVGDAFYMVVITIFGVGYGEVHPVETTSLRVLTILVIVFGYGAAIYTVGGFMQFLIDGELHSAFRSRKVSQGIAKLRDHTILCGYGRMGSIVANELKERGHPFLVIDENEARVAEAHDAGMLAMIGNATEEETLREAGIEHAKSLATMLPDDALNAFICVTVRDLNRSVEVVSRGESQSAEKRLRRCGADHVVMAAAIGAKRATQLLVHPSAESLLKSDDATHQLKDELSMIGLQMDELQIGRTSVLVGKNLQDIEVRGNRGFLIVAVRSVDGTVDMNPSGSRTLAAGDKVIVVGHRDDLAELCSAHTLKRQQITYRGATLS
ncbi:potassium channel family protein [Rhodopirellula sp. SWK7]|uniref:potassium channel family protein n=1 Tax=Rhodopirellula sp. SWK7 TaxID=595460 RepID=UPI0002BF982D|nr:potassium channel protein [Rhodopirellula sp. SWK7]EMI41011.1 TrkA-N domain protein [Rhodopirellula sp. SWK7]